MPLPGTRALGLEERPHDILENVDPGLNWIGPDCLRVNQHPQIFHLLLGFEFATYGPKERESSNTDAMSFKKKEAKNHKVAAWMTL